MFKGTFLWYHFSNSLLISVNNLENYVVSLLKSTSSQVFVTDSLLKALSSGSHYAFSNRIRRSMVQHFSNASLRGTFLAFQLVDTELKALFVRSQGIISALIGVVKKMHDANSLFKGTFGLNQVLFGRLFYGGELNFNTSMRLKSTTRASHGSQANVDFSDDIGYFNVSVFADSYWTPASF
jgi:hypothetical protein